jgi:hypothetical protein
MTTTDPDLRPRMTVAEIALMREIVKWRRGHADIDYNPLWSQYRTNDGGVVAWVALDADNDYPMVGVSPNYYGYPQNTPMEWHRVHSFTEAVDLLVALGYLPARFSTAYRAGYEAGCAVGASATSMAEAEALAPLPEMF